MITFAKYRWFLASLAEQSVQSLPIKSLLTRPPQTGDLYLKHDVETRPKLAARMARIETELGHIATYYFQGDLLETANGKTIAREIAELGHEVAYHFDVLDANDGNWNAAQAEFDRYCAKFAEIDCRVQTICPHGNPTKARDGWKSNKDFFRAAETRAAYPAILDIVVDFPAIFPTGRYVSDAGRKLRLIEDIAGNDTSNTAAMGDGVPLSWEDLPARIGNTDGLVLSLHPHRFATSAVSLYLQKYGFKFLKSAYLAVRRIPFVSKLASRFYYLARRL